MHNFTLEDLLQYAYNETSQKKTANIKNALDFDNEFQEKYLDMIAAQENLGELNFLPRKKTVDAILTYAERFVTA